MTASCIIGASSGLGRALAERLARNGHDLCLIASDERDLSAVAADIRIRHQRKVATLAVDLVESEPTAILGNFRDRFGAISNLFLIAGYTSEDDYPGSNDRDLERILTVNFVAPIRLANCFVPLLRDVPGANIVAIGSVAAIRARRKNSAYGASKRGLEFYFDALKVDLAEANCCVQFYRLGYVDTYMTFGQKLLFPVIPADRAAQVIEKGLGKRRVMRYLPAWWKLAEFLRCLPFSLFRRLKI